MSTPLVSVVVPTFNRAGVLPRAVASALAQTHQNVQVVIADDGSTDGTCELVARLWANEPRVEYHFQENNGVSAARNLGFAHSRGEFVALLDSDDEWVPWKLELQLAALRAYPDAGMIWTDMRAIGIDGHEVSPRYLRTMYSAWDQIKAEALFSQSMKVADMAPAELHDAVGSARVYSGDIFSQMVLGNLVHTSTVLIRRERLAAVGTFDEALYPAGEDYDFHLRTCRFGPVAFIDLPTINYEVGGADALSRHGDVLAVNFLKVVTRTLEQDRSRIHLTDSQIHWVLADAEGWVGGALLENGQGGARLHLLKSLRHRPLQPRVARQLAKSMVPSGLRAQVRRAYLAVCVALGVAM
jgi:glycosyltransferase involved in cell wall biosynthesis